MIDLKSVLKQYPNCLNSRASFKSVLMDKYPAEKRTVNILTILFECGIANKIKAKKSIDANEMHRLIAQIENEYGISGQYAQDAIMIWAAAFDVTVSAVKVNTIGAAAQQPPKPAVNKPVVYVQGNVDDYEVVKRPDGYYITRFNGFEEEEMTIPSMIDGKKIKGIAENVFEGCIIVKKIHISEGIEVIENGVFSECKALENVTLPYTLRQIGGKGAEYGGTFSLTGLETITIPQNVAFLGSSSFRYCHNLRKIELSDKIVTIYRRTFESCSKLSEIKLPDSLNTIGRAAFQECRSLTEIKLPSGLVTIEDEAFLYCSSLREVHIPAGTKKIGKDAFKGTKLTAIYIPPTVTAIGDNSARLSFMDETFESNLGNLTIYCAAGSVAMEYARKHGIKCAKAQF